MKNVIFMLIIFLITSCDGFVRVHGQVYNHLGEPLQGAVVTVYLENPSPPSFPPFDGILYKTFTKTDGTFDMSGLYFPFSFAYRPLIVYKSGYKPGIYLVRANWSTKINFYLAPDTAPEDSTTKR